MENKGKQEKEKERKPYGSDFLCHWLLYRPEILHERRCQAPAHELKTHETGKNFLNWDITASQQESPKTHANIIRLKVQP